jgi:competence protein ComEC
MNEQRGKKRDLRTIGFSAFALAVLLCCLVISLLPGGAAENWQRIFRFCGLGDFSSAADGSPLAVHILNVGKADSIFVECEGRSLLIDGATADYGDQVTSYLEQRGVKSLDLVVNTHPDSDHIGGLKTVLLRFPISRYFSPALPTDLLPKSAEYTGTIQALNSRGTREEHPKACSSVALGRLHITVLGPIRAGSSTNDNSIVLKLVFGQTSFLLMGDAEKAEEQALLEAGTNLQADVLKVGHHGSDTSTTQEFLNAVKPKFAAISVGDDFSNLPKASVSRRLAEAGTAVYRTDINGTILFLSDGKTITVQTEKS